MARPYWSGNVQISLVAFGVSLYVATESKGQISFHQISRRTGERIRHQKVLESAAESKEATTAVENDEIVKGYEYSKGKYVIIEPSELENLRIPSKHTIAVSQFVDVSDLNPEYIEKPYFVTPENDMSAEAFNVVRLAETLIARMSAKLDINKFEDGYETAVKALVEAKVNHLPVPIDEAPQQKPSNVVSLMDALRKSIGPDRASAKKPPKSVKEPPAKGIGIVKTPVKSAKRKSA